MSQLQSKSFTVLADETERAIANGEAVIAYRLNGGNVSTLVEYKPTSRANWASELRSGIPQTPGTLFRAKGDDEHPAGECCLGVLSRLGGADDKVSEGVGTPLSLNKAFATRLYRDTGLIGPNETLYGGGADDVTDAFTTANDTQGLTFDQIADGLIATRDLPADSVVQARALKAYFDSLHEAKQTFLYAPQRARENALEAGNVAQSERSRTDTY